MSILPKYTRALTDDEVESKPLVGGRRKSFDLEAQSPAYPPRPIEFEGDDPRAKVTYTFVPRWPIGGDQQGAIGVLGRTKAEAVAIVQGGMPRLAAYTADRIEFLIPMASPFDDSWGVVMDERWTDLVKSPPAHLRVQVQDGKGDAERREQRMARQQKLENTLKAINEPCQVVAIGVGIMIICWFVVILIRKLFGYDN